MNNNQADNLLASRQAGKQASRQAGKQASRQASRSAWLDVLKAFAMFGVILVHFNNAWNSPVGIISKVSAIGARCPQLFFIISSYLTWASLSRHEVKWTEFYRKRFIRIAPIFYVVLILATFIPELKSVSIGNWISHFLFLNGLVPDWTNSIMGMEWYIADLALFYMLVPLLRKMINNLWSSLIAFIGSAVLSSLSLIIYNATGGSADQAVQMYFETFFILHQIPVMILGIVLYYLIRKIGGRNVWKLLVGACTVAAVIGIVFIVLHLNKRYMTSSLIAGLAFTWIFLVAWVLRDVFERSIWKPLAFIGIHSFGIYCFHQIVINCVLRIVPHSEAVIWFSSLLLVIFASIMIGFGAEKAQEKMIR